MPTRVITIAYDDADPMGTISVGVMPSQPGVVELLDVIGALVQTVQQAARAADQHTAALVRAVATSGEGGDRADGADRPAEQG